MLDSFLALSCLASLVLPSQESHFGSPLLARKSLFARVPRHPGKKSKQAALLYILAWQNYTVTSHGSKQALPDYIKIVCSIIFVQID